jgi:hypothetical protein
MPYTHGTTASRPRPESCSTAPYAQRATSDTCKTRPASSDKVNAADYGPDRTIVRERPDIQAIGPSRRCITAAGERPLLPPVGRSRLAPDRDLRCRTAPRARLPIPGVTAGRTRYPPDRPAPPRTRRAVRRSAAAARRWRRVPPAAAASPRPRRGRRSPGIGQVHRRTRWPYAAVSPWQIPPIARWDLPGRSRSLCSCRRGSRPAGRSRGSLGCPGRA